MTTTAKTADNKGKFYLSQIVNFVVAIYSWYLLGYAFSYGASLDDKL